jgi:predicted molibdopterin-dependent oxidoreductase YjgC
MSDTAVIDGREVTIQQGESILDAARRSGADVPTLCYDGRLNPSGSCRLCSVKVAGRRLPVASCAQELVPGMEVATSDPELEAWRSTILGLALSESPVEDCPRCLEQGPCELHALASERGVDGDRFQGGTSGAPVDDANPFILRDYSRCIYCYRCTRVCGELEQAHAIAPAGRGFDTRIVAGFDGGLLDSPCTFCGQCIQTCPTGALMDRKMLGKARADEVTRVRTVCPFCGTGCGINLNVAGGNVIGVTPDWDSPASEGALCVKGQFGTDFVHSPDRLTSPLIRRDGRLVEATWDEAYDLVAARFRQVREESGPSAFALWSSARATSEANYLMQKLARGVIGTNNIDNCART